MRRPVRRLPARQRGRPHMHVNLSMPLIKFMGDARATRSECGEAQTRVAHSGVSLI
jgi:hypothetical protein